MTPLTLLNPLWALGLLDGLPLLLLVVYAELTMT